jgi:hypothetical protein
VDGDDKEAAALKYRDRARERREGVLGEYEETAQILHQLNKGYTCVCVCVCSLQRRCMRLSGTARDDG